MNYPNPDECPYCSTGVIEECPNTPSMAAPDWACTDCNARWKGDGEGGYGDDGMGYRSWPTELITDGREG